MYPIGGQVWKCLNNVDWDLLSEQKKALIDVVDIMNSDASDSFFSSKEQIEAIDAIDGIINLIGALQDEAEDKGIWVGLLHLRDAKSDTP